METTALESLSSCERSAEKIDDIVRQADSPRLRAPLLAEMLRSLWPSFALYSCLLGDEDDPHLCVLDANGKSRNDLADLWLTSIFQPGPQLDELVPMPPGPLPTPAHQPAIAEITFRGHRWGVLAIAIPKDAPSETLCVVRILLKTCAEQLAARLDAEVQDRRVQALQKELQEQFWLANTGEVAGPLVHEVNNFLNIVSLHVALVEADTSQKSRAECTELRRQAINMTSTVKQFQQCRRRHQSVREPLEINELVRDAICAVTAAQSDPDQPLVIHLPAGSHSVGTGPTTAPQHEVGDAAGVRLNVVLAPALPAVLGSAADVKRLCTLLLANAAAAAAPVGGSVVIRTEPCDGNVVLRVEDDGPSASSELLAHFFEPRAVERPGTNSLELAACEALVRRLQSKISCENRADRGVAILVQFRGE
jgi:signal transduction histidine kinase